MVVARSGTLSPQHYLFSTFGTLGDLNPYLAVGLELRARGHRVTLATYELYRGRIESLGLGFARMRPDVPDPHDAPEMMKRLMERRYGTERILREWVLPTVRESYEDLWEASKDATVMVSHPLTFAVRPVAEKRGLRWASTLLQPIGMFSAHDPSMLPRGAWLIAMMRLWGPGGFRALKRLMLWYTRHWPAEVHALRAELGLPPAPNPMFDGQHSPYATLAMFSRHFAASQPDWPASAVQTGFPFLDAAPGEALLPPELEGFLHGGPPPLVFTLGTSAVHDARGFFHEAAEAARMLGLRAVLVSGKDPRNKLDHLPEGVMQAEYASYAALFPRALAIMHQGGVGTTAQALRAGRPQIIHPYSHDQPDNAARIERLGCGLAYDRPRATARSLVRVLGRLLDQPGLATRATELGKAISAENGVREAADALERVAAAELQG